MRSVETRLSRLEQRLIPQSLAEHRHPVLPEMRAFFNELAPMLGLTSLWFREASAEQSILPKSALTKVGPCLGCLTRARPHHATGGHRTSRANQRMLVRLDGISGGDRRR